MKMKARIVQMFMASFLAGCLSEGGIENTDACSKYDRDAFGYGDVDYDDDGCYARAELLISKSLVPVEKSQTSRCRVLRGKWVDAYSDDTLYEADSVEIDHVVALKEAHLSGAYQWPSAKLTGFGNRDSLGEMVITRGSTNQRKSDLDISEWLPPGEARRVEYARKWVRIKAAWGLAADEEEIQAIKAVLGDDVQGLPAVAPEYNCP
jgi:hypothetical protein